MTETGSGQGTLVSYAAWPIAIRSARLAKAYGADAVDMEAAAVAQAAQAHGIEFVALKAISDAADFSCRRRIDLFRPTGSFGLVRFAVHVALRPWLWKRTITLARNSAKASRALSASIREYCKREIGVLI